jgi:hypothetical protein
MGFKEPLAPGSLQASFTSVTVYEARGINPVDGATEAIQSTVAGAEYRVSVGKSVNAACQALIGDDFEESEDEWRKTVKSQGPFALVAVGPTDYFACGDGRMMRTPDGAVATYDCFPQAREALRALERRVLPPVIAALTCSLNEPDRFVALRKLGRASAGRTPDRVTVHDIRMEFRAEGYVSYAVSPATLAEKLNAVAQRAPRLNQRAAGFFALGVGEDDQLKKFLYFFLALEIETHAVFGRINHRNKLQATLVADPTVRHATTHLLHKQVESLTNLFDRFVWCATCTWTNLTDADIGLFKSLKDARDAIAHGRASEPPAGYARSAELLAHRVIWRP